MIDEAKARESPKGEKTETPETTAHDDTTCSADDIHNAPGTPSPDVAACLQTILHGFTIGDTDLFPLSQHQKARLFDEEK
eukprot:scaffold8681_cov200-Amphora_coffeaeformis.AAC.8